MLLLLLYFLFGVSGRVRMSFGLVLSFAEIVLKEHINSSSTLIMAPEDYQRKIWSEYLRYQILHNSLEPRKLLQAVFFQRTHIHPRQPYVINSKCNRSYLVGTANEIKVILFQEGSYSITSKYI